MGRTPGREAALPPLSGLGPLVSSLLLRPRSGLKMWAWGPRQRGQALPTRPEAGPSSLISDFPVCKMNPDDPTCTVHRLCSTESETNAGRAATPPQAKLGRDLFCWPPPSPGCSPQRPREGQGLPEATVSVHPSGADSALLLGPPMARPPGSGLPSPLPGMLGR